MQSLGAWLAMGSYAAFVWPAYAIAALVLGGIAVQSWRRHRASTASLDRLQRQTGSPE